MASNPCRFYRQSVGAEREQEPISLPRERVEQIAEVLDYLLQSVMPVDRMVVDPVYVAHRRHLADAAMLRDELRELLAPSPYGPEAGE